MIAPKEQVEQKLAGATKLGEQSGNTYYFLPSTPPMPGIGQIVKVLNADHTKYAMVGMLLSGKLTINPSEKADFEPIQDSMTVKQARALGMNGEAAHPAPGSATGTPGSADSDRPGCVASALLATYWDGKAWQPMIEAAHTGRENGVSLKGLGKALAKNPLSSFGDSAGTTSISTFEGTAAITVLPAKPVLCVVLRQDQDLKTLAIVALTVEKDHRELETCAGGCNGTRLTTDDWSSAKDRQPIEVRRVSATTVEVTPKSALKPGQYLLGGPKVIFSYDFGVAAAGTN